MDLGIDGKSAVVTGGAGGIGSRTAGMLAAEGCRVCVLDLNGRGAAEVANRVLEAGGADVMAVQCDVTDRASVEAAFEQAEARLGTLQILINSHQVWPTAWFDEITDEAWRRAIDVNLTSYFLTCQAMVRQLRRRSSPGSLLNITSQAAFRGSTTGHAHYAAAKAGILGLTRSIAREGARDGIVCNALAPGMARTPATAAALEAREDEYLERIPIGRIAEPEEVAAVAVFLVSERAGYMTGATVDVSGGMLMH